MKKVLIAVFIASLSLAHLSNVNANPAQKAAIAGELAEHPRIATAVADLEDAIAYMENAPHDFGGHKAAAIAACHKAINQLRKAMAYRAKKDANQ